MVDDLPVWSIVCFMVRPGYRRGGMTKRLLAAVTDYAREMGAPALEAYPIDPEGTRVSTAFLYVGTVKTFEEAGFRKVVQTGSVSAGLPRWLMRMEL
jgi:GNAT superfamily N-acetyltransferase